MASPLSNPKSNPGSDPDDAGHVPMTEEFDSFKHTMPSAGPVVIAMVLLAIAVGAAAYFLRATPVASGSIDQAFAVNVPGQGAALATVQLSLTNISKKPLFLKNVKITIRTNKGEFSDDFGSVPTSNATSRRFRNCVNTPLPGSPVNPASRPAVGFQAASWSASRFRKSRSTTGRE